MLKLKKSTLPPGFVLDKLNKSYDIRPFPRVVTQLLSKLKDPNVKPAEIAHIVEADAALSAKILRMANSPVFGVANVIQTIEQATVILGVSRLKNMAHTFAAASMFSNNGDSSKYRDELWDHSLGCATVGRLIAKLSKKASTDEAFLAGVFHDVGQLFFLDIIPAEYGPLIEAHSGTELVQLEKEQFEVDHQAVGVKLATAWQLPESIMVAIGYHHQPENAIAHNDLTNIVHVANGITRSAGIGTRVDSTIDMAETAERLLGLNAVALEAIEQKAIEDFEATKQVYS